MLINEKSEITVIQLEIKIFIIGRVDLKKVHVQQLYGRLPE